MRGIRVAVCAYTAAIAGAEALALTGSFTFAALAHALLVLALLNHHLALRERIGKPADAFLALALVPLLRLVSVTMAQDDIDPVYRQLVLGFPLLLAAATAASLLRAPRRIASLRPRSLVRQAAIALVGLPIAYAAVRVAQPEDTVAGLEGARLVAFVIAVVVLVGYTEELIFRGVLQESLRPAFGRWGILLATALFALVYASVRPPEVAAIVVATGLLLAVLVEWSASVVGAGIAHGIVAAALAIDWAA